MKNLLTVGNLPTISPYHVKYLQKQVHHIWFDKEVKVLKVIMKRQPGRVYRIPNMSLDSLVKNLMNNLFDSTAEHKGIDSRPYPGRIGFQFSNYKWH